jgi:hypothetical protein
MVTCVEAKRDAPELRGRIRHLLVGYQENNYGFLLGGIRRFVLFTISFISGPGSAGLAGGFFWVFGGPERRR